MTNGKISKRTMITIQSCACDLDYYLMDGNLIDFVSNRNLVVECVICVGCPGEAVDNAWKEVVCSSPLV